VSALALLARELKGTPGAFEHLLEMASFEVRRAQARQKDRIPILPFD
jgi:hypothetical protein